MRDRQFRHARKHNPTALLIGLVGAVAVLTAAATPAIAIPTGVTAGHGISTALPLISEIGGAVGSALLVLGFVLYYRRRPGSHL